MTLNQVKSLLDAKVLCGEDQLDMEINSVFASDFMSDILAFSKDQQLLLTGMINPQVIRTAEMVDMKCVVFVRGKMPDEGMVALAKEENIIILSTQKLMYESCGILYLNNLGR